MTTTTSNHRTGASTTQGSATLRANGALSAALRKIGEAEREALDILEAEMVKVARALSLRYPGKLVEVCSAMGRADVKVNDEDLPHSRAPRLLDVLEEVAETYGIRPTFFVLARNGATRSLHDWGVVEPARARTELRALPPHCRKCGEPHGGAACPYYGSGVAGVQPVAPLSFAGARTTRKSSSAQPGDTSRAKKPGRSHTAASGRIART